MKKNLIPFLIMFFCSFCFGLFFLVIFMNAREIICTRQADQTYTCEFKTLFLGKYQIGDRTVENITQIMKQRDSCDGGCAYRAEFVTKDGKHEPLSSVWTDEGPVLEQVNTIGSQMDSAAQEISYRADPPMWVLYLIGGLTVMLMLLTPLIFLRGRNK